MSENENAGFSRKDWPLWLLIYLLVSLLYNLCNAVPGPWYAWLALLSIFILAFSCLQVWKKYIDCQKFISRYATPDGKVLIEPQFSYGYPFENGIAKVTYKGEQKVVDNSQGEYHYWDSDDWFYIDKQGNKINQK